MTRSQLISSLVEDKNWFLSIELNGVPLNPNLGEEIYTLAERIADNLENKGLIEK